MNFPDNYQIADIFTGDALFAWLETHVCNQQQPGLFTHSFEFFSDLTGYLPHLLFDTVSGWTLDENRVSEIGGVASLLLNLTAGIVALSLRIIVAAFLLLGLPLAVGGALFVLSPALPFALPFALCAAGMTAAVLLAGAGLAKYMEGVPDPDLHREVKNGISAFMNEHEFDPFEDELLTINGEEVPVANGFVIDMRRNNERNTINGIVFKDPEKAAEEILRLLDGDRKILHEISQIFNQNSALALRHLVIQIYKTSCQPKEREGYDPYFNKIPASYALVITPEKEVVLTVTTQADIETEYYEMSIEDVLKKWRYEAGAVYDFNRQTVTTEIRFKEI